MSKIFKAFQEHEHIIRRIVAKYRSNPSDIEELTQETFIKAYAAELKQDILEPEKFLYRTAKNLSITQGIRKEHSTTKSIEDSGGIEVIQDETYASQEDVLDAKQKMVLFAEAIESLSPKLREALLMRRVEGLKIRQIATRLGVSVSAVEKRMASAMIDCQKYLRQKGLDPADFGAAPSASKQKPQIKPLKRSPRTSEREG